MKRPTRDKYGRFALRMRCLLILVHSSLCSTFRNIRTDDWRVPSCVNIHIKMCNIQNACARFEQKIDDYLHCRPNNNRLRIQETFFPDFCSPKISDYMKHIRSAHSKNLPELQCAFHTFHQICGSMLIDPEQPRHTDIFPLKIGRYCSWHMHRLLWIFLLEVKWGHAPDMSMKFHDSFLARVDFGVMLLSVVWGLYV